MMEVFKKLVSKFLQLTVFAKEAPSCLAGSKNTSFTGVVQKQPCAGLP